MGLPVVSEEALLFTPVSVFIALCRIIGIMECYRFVR